jgi:hydroxymethylglutaryl-CoA synthase
MRGILSAAGSIPYWRLQRSAIGAFHGSGGGKGTRSVASYDEDSTTLAVDAARNALRGAPEAATPSALWFTTTTPTYLEKSNAGVAHAALRLPTTAGAYDLGGSLRSGVGALRAALTSSDTVVVAAADLRVGLPNSPDESAGGDAGAALVVGDGDGVIAEYLGGASASQEFLDRWRTPGDQRTKQWEEKFGEQHYVTLARQAWGDALAATGIEAGDVDEVVIATAHPRAANVVAKQLAVTVAPDLAATVGNAGVAQPLLLLTAALEGAAPARTIALVALADGADVLLFRTTDAIGSWTPARPVADQLASGNDTLPYAKYLAWRQVMSPEPPRRPEPARVSASAAGRSVDWKYGFVGSRDRESKAVHLPPARVSFEGGNVDDMEPVPMADVAGTVLSATVDRLAYSPSPPVIFAVVDFDGGGRLPIELCDCTADDASPGARVEMTFRRLNAADGIANYFWKARPIRRVT